MLQLFSIPDSLLLGQVAFFTTRRDLSTQCNETHTFHISNFSKKSAGLLGDAGRRMAASGKMENFYQQAVDRQQLVSYKDFQDCQLHQYITRTLTAWCKLYHTKQPSMEAAWGGGVQRAAVMKQDCLQLLGRPMPE